MLSLNAAVHPGSIVCRCPMSSSDLGFPRSVDAAGHAASSPCGYRRRGTAATAAEPADHARNRLARRGRNGGRPPGTAKVYKERNIVERAIGRLRQHRAVAIRYDKRDFVGRGTIDVASIRIWLRGPSHYLRNTAPRRITVDRGPHRARKTQARLGVPPSGPPPSRDQHLRRCCRLATTLRTVLTG
jgi:hypothetical protein